MSLSAIANPASTSAPTIADALGLFYPAANAAYGCQDPAHLLIGNNFAFRSQIKVDPQRAVQVPVQHFPLLTSMLKSSPIFGFVATRPGAVCVSLRGTETLGEWLCDFEAVPTPYQIGTGAVHEGFQKVYQVIRESSLEALRSVLNLGDEVFITGHSLGAALAILFANDAVSLTSNLQVCTFAGPRTGLGDFVSSYNQRVPRTLRVVNRWDLVPNVPVPAPPRCLYRHVGSLLAIDGGFTFDLAHAHSLSLSYLPGLKKQTSQ
jgi:triacylglycerol lipase